MYIIHCYFAWIFRKKFSQIIQGGFWIFEIQGGPAQRGGGIKDFENSGGRGSKGGTEKIQGGSNPE